MIELREEIRKHCTSDPNYVMHGILIEREQFLDLNKIKKEREEKSKKGDVVDGTGK